MIVWLRRSIASLITSLLDWFAALTGFYYSRKYAATVRRLGLRPVTHTDRSTAGLVIVEIDGLSNDALLDAMQQHRAANLRRLISRHGYIVSPWRSGLPSTTPAAQAGIMYGNNDNIPAFRWYDKRLGRPVAVKYPPTVAALQQQVAQGNSGLLAGGTSYVNMFDGGAESALFTLSSLQPRRFFARVRGAGLIALFALNPLRSLRVMFLSLQEYVTDVVQRYEARRHRHPHWSALGIAPLLRVVSNVLIREIETFAVLVDIYRGVPVIYACYTGHDQTAHHFGVDSRAALQAVQAIDRCIGQIERICRAKLTRNYTLVVLSDHGLTPSEPFAKLYEQTLSQLISSKLDPGLLVSEPEDEFEEDPLHAARLLLDEWRAIEANLGSVATAVARRMRILVLRSVRERRHNLQWDATKQNDVVVQSSGSLAHVYFNLASHRMELGEIAAAFPSLAMELLSHPGIWLVVAREGHDTLIMARGGMLTVGREGSRRLDGTHPLQRLPDPEHAIGELQRLADFDQSGDLILVGDYDPQSNRVVCFEQQWASHGGLGGAQDRPFIMYPRRLRWDLAQVSNACDIYPLLADIRAAQRPR